MRKTEFIDKACDPSTLTAGQLMQDALFTCTPRTDLLSIVRIMTKWNFGSLPVVEEDRTLVGLVSEYDALQAVIEGRDLRKLSAEDIMSRQVLSVTEDASLVQVANLFQDRYVTRLPVVRGKKLVGLVARRDLLFGYVKACQYWS